MSEAPCMLTGVPIRQLGLWWPAVEPLLEPALRRTGGLMETRHVLEDLNAGQMQLWVVLAGESEPARIAAVLTRIVDYPLKSICRIEYVAGSAIGRWRHLIGQIRDFARRQGCTALEAVARPGWRRIYPDWRVKRLLLSQEI
jgi:hypothetical protein